MNGKPTPDAVDGGELFKILCDDGVDLVGCFYPRTLAVESSTGGVPHLPVLIAGATDVPQQFYRGFAAWLAAHGHDVLTFDYRGIGLSRQGALKHSQAGLPLTGVGGAPLVAMHATAFASTHIGIGILRFIRLSSFFTQATRGA